MALEPVTPAVDPPVVPATPEPTLAELATTPPNPERPEPAHPYDEKALADKPSRHFEGARAKKDQARAGDVPAIQDLSRMLRTLKGEGGDAPRVQALRQQIREALELEPAKATEKPVDTKPAATLPPAQPDGFTEAEPKIEDFIGKADDPYLAHARALAKYDRRKDAADERQAQYQHHAQQYQQQAAQFWQGVDQSFGARVQKFAQENPEGWKTLQAHPRLNAMSPVMLAAVKLLPTAEQDCLHWANDPVMLDQLFFQTVNQPVTEDAVAYVQRCLTSRPTTGTTGAVAPPPTPRLAPRPPTPVRTSAMTTTDDPANDPDDLESHRKRYGVGGRRR